MVDEDELNRLIAKVKELDELKAAANELLVAVEKLEAENKEMKQGIDVCVEVCESVMVLIGIDPEAIRHGKEPSMAKVIGKAGRLMLDITTDIGMGREPDIFKKIAQLQPIIIKYARHATT